MTDNACKDLNLTFIRGGRAMVGKQGSSNSFWSAYNKINEENKFYLPMHGRAELFIDGTHYPMERGRWFLIGAEEYRSYYTAGTELEKWVVHFYGQANGKSVKETFDLPDFVDLNPKEYETALRLMQRVKEADMQSPVNLYELFENKGKIFDILSYYTQLAKEQKKTYIKQRDAQDRIRTIIFESIKETGVNYLDTKELARAIGMNERYFLEYFKKLFLIAPNQLVLRTRLVKARGLLEYDTLDVQDIARECGFESASYFCEYFKKYMGISPKQYRKEFKKQFLKYRE